MIDGNGMWSDVRSRRREIRGVERYLFPLQIDSRALEDQTVSAFTLE
jgi:hypothetical protein